MKKRGYMGVGRTVLMAEQLSGVLLSFSGGRSFITRRSFRFVGATYY